MQGIIQEPIFSIFLVVIFISILFYIFRSILTALIISTIAVLLFRIGWVYNADELFEKFKLREILSTEAQIRLYENYDNYVQKRDKVPKTIDPKKIDGKIQEREDDFNERLNDYKKNNK